MIITISGKPGSGKTTVAKMLAKKLGYKFYSIGDMRGEIAMQMGITIDELNEIGKTEDWTDKKVDEYQKNLGKKDDNFVIDSWLGFHFIPHSIKIFLEVNMSEAARRVFADQRPDEQKRETKKEVIQMLKKRLDDTSYRYKEYYDLDFLDTSHYDLVLDTTHLTIDQVVEKIIDFLKKKGI
jgi:predicted cytidylate kinase